ncbi:hypothetical protein [Halobacillus sp. B29]
MKRLKEGRVMSIAGMLAALVVSIFFYFCGLADYWLRYVMYGFSGEIDI